jgi:hypothetical protein
MDEDDRMADPKLARDAFKRIMDENPNISLEEAQRRFSQVARSDPAIMDSVLAGVFTDAVEKHGMSPAEASEMDPLEMIERMKRATN